MEIVCGSMGRVGPICFKIDGIVWKLDRIFPKNPWKSRFKIDGIVWKLDRIFPKNPWKSRFKIDGIVWKYLGTRNESDELLLALK